MSNVTINVCALFRNSQAHIHRTLEQLSNLTLIEGINWNFFFFENDSRDNTKEILSNWSALYGAKLISENYNAPSFGSIASSIRTSLLAFYRNKIKEEAAQVPSDYTLVIDSDLTWTNQDFEELYTNLIYRSDNTVAVLGSCVQTNIGDFTFGTEHPAYYDLFCFRDKFYGAGLYFSCSPFVDSRDTSIFMLGQPVEVKSGFGGMALYKSFAYNAEGTHYEGQVQSEHISLCAGLSRFGQILAIPTCKPTTMIDLSTINIENCKLIGKQQLEQYHMTNQLRELSVADEYKFKFNQ